MVNAPDKKFVTILLLSCVLIESVHQLIGKFMVVGLYEFAGFYDYRITYLGVVGCVDALKEPFTRIPMLCYQLLLIYWAYRLSKHIDKRNKQLIGALLIYYFVSGTFTSIGMSLIQKQVPFIPHLNIEFFQKIEMPFFGNYFNYKVVIMVIKYMILVSGIFVCYQMIFRLWDKTFRKQIFTYGFIGSLTGIGLWYFIIGPLLFPYS